MRSSDSALLCLFPDVPLGASVPAAFLPLPFWMRRLGASLWMRLLRFASDALPERFVPPAPVVLLVGFAFLMLHYRGALCASLLLCFASDAPSGHFAPVAPAAFSCCTFCALRALRASFVALLMRCHCVSPLMLVFALCFGCACCALHLRCSILRLTSIAPSASPSLCHYAI